MTYSEFQHLVEKTMGSADVAAGYVRRMVEKETRGWGDGNNALTRLARRYGLSHWTLNHLRTGRAKTVEAGVFARIKSAYLDLCERQIQKLQQEIAIEKALHHDDYFEGLEQEAEALAERLAAQKQAVLRRPATPQRNAEGTAGTARNNGEVT